jgi:hypothetical protein
LIRHGLQQVHLERLQLHDDPLRPVLLAQHVAVLRQLPQPLGAVVALVLDVLFERLFVVCLQRLRKVDQFYLFIDINVPSVI